MNGAVYLGVMFAKYFFAGNRARLAKNCQCDLVVLSANGMVQKSVDVPYPFRQDSNFWYLTGIDIADAVFVLDIKQGKEFVILPPRDAHRDQWEGALDTAVLSATSGIADILDSRTGWARLTERLMSAKRVGSIIPTGSYVAVYGMHYNPAKVRFARKLKRLASSKLQDVRLDMAHLRQVKQPQEITCIEKAVAITKQSLDLLKDHVKTMRSERDIDIFLSHQFRLLGGDGHAYDPIVAYEEHAATIHYQDNNGDLGKGGLLLMDVGASLQGYAADISRTYAIAAKPNQRRTDVYNAVARVHQYAIGLLAPGVEPREYERQVEECMGKELQALGLLSSMDRRQIRQFFPHLTSHFLGKDVHDSGDYEQTLAENTVITVEPGIYIPDEGIGVRIEDNIVITKDGCRNLSAELSLDLLYYV